MRNESSNPPEQAETSDASALDAALAMASSAATDGVLEFKALDLDLSDGYAAVDAGVTIGQSTLQMDVKAVCDDTACDVDATLVGTFDPPGPGPAVTSELSTTFNTAEGPSSFSGTLGGETPFGELTLTCGNAAEPATETASVSCRGELLVGNDDCDQAAGLAGTFLEVDFGSGDVNAGLTADANLMSMSIDQDWTLLQGNLAPSETPPVEPVQFDLDRAVDGGALSDAPVSSSASGDVAVADMGAISGTAESDSEYSAEAGASGSSAVDAASPSEIGAVDLSDAALNLDYSGVTADDSAWGSAPALDMIGDSDRCLNDPQQDAALDEGLSDVQAFSAPGAVGADEVSNASGTVGEFALDAGDVYGITSDDAGFGDASPTPSIAQSVFDDTGVGLGLDTGAFAGVGSDLGSDSIDFGGDAGGFDADPDFSGDLSGIGGVDESSSGGSDND